MYGPHGPLVSQLQRTLITLNSEFRGCRIPSMESHKTITLIELHHLAVNWFPVAEISEAHSRTCARSACIRTVSSRSSQVKRGKISLLRRLRTIEHIQGARETAQWSDMKQLAWMTLAGVGVNVSGASKKPAPCGLWFLLLPFWAETLREFLSIPGIIRLCWLQIV